MKFIDKLFSIKKECKKDTYDMDVTCSNCLAGNNNSINTYQIKIGHSPIGAKIACKNCGISSSIELGTGRDGFNRYYIN